MKQLLIIPDKNQMESCLGLAKEYNLGFEYNDFFEPDVLEALCNNLSEYQNYGVCLDYAHAFLSHTEPEICSLASILVYCGEYKDISHYIDMAIECKDERIRNKAMQIKARFVDKLQ